MTAAELEVALAKIDISHREAMDMLDSLGKSCFSYCLVSVLYGGLVFLSAESCVSLNFGFTFLYYYANSYTRYP